MTGSLQCHTNRSIEVRPVTQDYLSTCYLTFSQDSYTFLMARYEPGGSEGCTFEKGKTQSCIPFNMSYDDVWLARYHCSEHGCGVDARCIHLRSITKPGTHLSSIIFLSGIQPKNKRVSFPSTWVLSNASNQLSQNTGFTQTILERVL